MLATGRIAEAGQILRGWAGSVDAGMLPNRFPDDGGAPEFNTCDAALWFIVAVHDYLARAKPAAVEPLRAAVLAILAGYAGGTRFGIAADADGLLRAGVPGMQLTWMDAKLGDRVITPRIGKPVEIEALWINALRIGGQWEPRWTALAERAQAAFLARFPNPACGGLYDVIDAGHVAGAVESCIRPNQIFAVGGLPFAVLEGEAAAAVLALVERHLLTPLGLRSLSPGDAAYVGHYRGGPAARDGAYHQGTVWPWLMGGFVQAWLRVHGDGEAQRAEARARFLAPLLAHLDTAGLGHVSEVADGDAPHTPGGCPFQAWSLGETIRIAQWLAPPEETAP
jgi:predicted glycogen debranching enzyme